MLDSNLNKVRDAIAQSRKRHARADAVRLVAVSKTKSAAEVASAARLGICDFGENYAQEGIAKIAQVTQSLGTAADKLTWHFIGGVQSRKCKDIATNFDWVHSIERIKIADKLNSHRRGAALNVLLQLNLQGEKNKSGVREAELFSLAVGVAKLPNLKLRGLMCIPKAEQSSADARAVYQRCRELLNQLNARGFHLDQLSMGMSGDIDIAIAAGATMLRVGSAIFGARK